MPAKTQNTEVKCSDSKLCIGNDYLKPTVGYSGALKTFIGRYLDSTYEGDSQAPMRTIRAGEIKYNAAHSRIYQIQGSTFVAYDAQRFIDRLNRGDRLSTADPHVGQPIPEEFLSWDRSFYAEYSGWEIHSIDHQQMLFDFDFDDRGNIYLAYSIFGWGIAKDDYGIGGAIPSVFQSLQGANNTGVDDGSIMSIKTSDGHYYALVGSTAGVGSVTELWDTTNPANSVFRGATSHPFRAYAKNSDGSVIAYIDGGTGDLLIYTADALVSGGNPLKRVHPNSPFASVTSDGTGFYADGAQSPLVIYYVAPVVGAGYVDTKIVPNISLYAASIQYGGGYILITGSDASFHYDYRLLRANGATLTDVDMTAYASNAQLLIAGGNRYFTRYYAYVPTGYLKPEQTTFSDGFPLKLGSHTYLVVAMRTLGDVYEVQGSDGVSITSNGTVGTANPNSAQTGAGPYYGDPLSFTSTTTATASFPVTWNFGNPEAPDNTQLVQTATNVTHQYSGLTAGTITNPRAVTVTSATDSSITDSYSLTMSVPVARVRLIGTSTVFTAPASSTAAILTSDHFADASDGTIEGHFDTWSIDSAQTKTIPSASVSVGGCGAHTLNFTGHYGPYQGSGSSLISSGTDLPIGINGITYSAVPFAAVINAPTSDSTNITFVSGSRLATDAASVPNGSQTSFAYKWELLDASGASVVTPSTGTSTLSQIPAFVVPKTTFVSLGMKAKLTLSVDSSQLGATCQSFTTSASSTAALNAPDPQINVTSGCAFSGSPCSLTVVSASGADLSAWSLSWSVTPNGPNTGGTATTYAPSFVNAGVYVASVIATNAVGSSSATKQLSIATPQCTGDPTGKISVGYAGTTSLCSANVTCSPGERINFTAYPFGYTFNSNCDVYSWNFGDSSSSSNTATTASASHTYNTVGTYHTTFTITNGSHVETVPATVVVGTTTGGGGGSGGGGGGGGQTCPNITSSSLFVSYNGTQTFCTANTNYSCNASEPIAFTAFPSGGYDVNCQPHTYAWSFGDGTTGTGFTTSHSYASSGTYQVSVRVTAGGLAVTMPVQAVRVGDGGNGGGGGGSCSAPTAQNVYLSMAGATSGCNMNSPTCAQNETLHFGVASLNGYNFSCGTTTYDWDYGDNSVHGSTQTANHSYANAGSYTAKVTMTNSGGTVTFTQPVTISGTSGGQCQTPTTINMFITYVGPTTTCSQAGGDCSPSEAVSFALAPFNGYNFNCGPHTYSWNFNDGGSTSTAATPTHVFSGAGNYDVTCTVQNGSGSVTLHQTVKVGSGSGVTPKVAVRFTYLATDSPEEIQFVPTVDLPALVKTWTWNFGDGTTTTATGGSNPKNQTHAYDGPGVYHVTLTATDGGTVLGSAAADVTVATSPRRRPSRH